MAAYQDEAQKYGFTVGGGLNETMKQDISNRYRDELFRTVIQDAFKLIAEKEAMAAERALLKELNAIKQELNKTTAIELTDITVSADKPTSGLAGAVVAVNVPDTITDKDSWSVTLDSEGKGKITFTVLGYLMAGAPNELKLYEAGSSQSGEPDQTISFVASYPTTVVELSSSDEEKMEQPKIKPTESATTPQQPAGKYAWVLAETITNDSKADIEHTNKGGKYQDTASASPGSYTYSSKYIGETDTYPDSDMINGEGYGVKLDISAPPSVIQGGDMVSLSFNLAFTSQNLSYFDGNGSCRSAILLPPRPQPGERKGIESGYGPADRVFTLVRPIFMNGKSSNNTVNCEGDFDMRPSISWQNSVPIFKNSVILKQLGFAIGIPFGLVALIIGLTSGKSIYTVYALGLLGALLFFTWIFILLVYRGRYEAEFVLDENGVLCRTQAKQQKINRTVNALTAVLGLLSGKPGIAGTGLLAHSKQEVLLQWKSITKFKCDSRRQIIFLWSGRMEQIALFCTPDNYDQVKQFVLEKTHRLSEVKPE